MAALPLTAFLAVALSVLVNPLQTGEFLADLRRSAEELFSAPAVPGEPSAAKQEPEQAAQLLERRHPAPEKSPVGSQGPAKAQPRGEPAGSNDEPMASGRIEHWEREAPQADQTTGSRETVNGRSKTTRALVAAAEEFYGANLYLGIDLMKDFNPGLVGQFRSGGPLRFPPLDRETLVRGERDGSFRLILAAFASRHEAEEFAQTVRAKGYRAAITPRRIAGDLLLQRVEIKGLKNWKLIELAWSAARQYQWISFNSGYAKSRS